MRSILRAHRALAVSLVVALILAGCAGVPPGGGNAPVLADRAFETEGRLTARHGNDAVTAHFRWVHAPPRDALELSTPLGQIVAELSGDSAAHEAEVRLSDGRSLRAGDWATLTQRALGFPLPVAGLASWVRGGAHADGPYQSETDARGRTTLLRQDGWEIVFDYADDSSETPMRMRMSYPDVEVRIALDRPVAR